MTVDSVISAISVVGFPIICAVAMAIFVKYMFDKYRDEVKTLNEQHHKEIMEITEQHKRDMSDSTTALNNNTLAIQQLADFIRGGKDNG